MTTEQIAEDKGLVRVYEVAYLVSPNVPEDKVAETVGRLKAVLDSQKAFVLSEDSPKFRQLAYTLVKPLGGKNEKYTSAYFGWIKFEILAEGLPAIKTALEKDLQIVRFLLVKADKESKIKSKPAFWRKDAVKREAPKTVGGKSPHMSEAEIDKEIDKTIEELAVQ